MEPQCKSDQIINNSEIESDIGKGMAAAWPICLGYIPLGLTLGVLAQKAGLSPYEIGIMSFVVFAGSAQFIAVAMIVESASSASIIMTTFIVNLRHMLMSSSLALYLGRENRKKLTIFSHTITDESFVINSEKFKNSPWNLNRALSVNYTAYLAWFFSTLAGGYFGQFISEKSFGMEYAMTAMFICLLVLQLDGKIYVITGLLSGLIAVVAAIYIPGNWYVIIGSVLSAAICAALKNHKTRKVLK